MIVDLAIKLTAAAAVAWIVTFRVRPRYAAAAHALWLVALVGPLLSTGVNALIPPVVIASVRRSIADAVAPSSVATAVLVWIYALVSALLLARIAIGYLSVVRLVRGSTEISGTELADLRTLAGVGTLRVREGAVGMPVVAGIFRPVVLLPGAWRAFSRRSLTAILRHEAAHVRRRDPAVALLAGVMEALLWFTPAVWLARRRLTWFAEMACDADASASMGTQPYAQELLHLAAAWSGIRPPRFLLASGAASRVGTRVGLLLDELEHASRGRRQVVAGACLLGILLLLATAIRVVPIRGSGPAIDTLHDHEAAHRHSHVH